MTIELLDSMGVVDTSNAYIRKAVAAPAGDVLGRIANLETRLARSAAEVDAAQAVRYRVFVEEMKAQVAPEAGRRKRDIDSWDAICDHLLVLDTSIEGDAEEQIVGTYRLLRQDVAERTGGFYSASEFAIGELLSRHPDKRFMELGRSCVLPEYRSKRTVEALWQGIWAYVHRFGIDVMAGCASFRGTIPAAHAQALSYLAHNFRAGPEWDVQAVPERYRSMDLMPPEAVNARAALAAMPPLVKAYLRVGARIGDGCVIDHDFRTTDVFIILPVEDISHRYIGHYGAEAQRFAA